MICSCGHRHKHETFAHMYTRPTPILMCVYVHKRTLLFAISQSQGIQFAITQMHTSAAGPATPHRLLYARYSYM